MSARFDDRMEKHETHSKENTHGTGNGKEHGERGMGGIAS